MASDLVNSSVVAGQASQFISIVPENGEQYVPGQKIIYNIEPEIGYIKKDSYIIFDILNNSTDKCRATLEPRAGIHAIIDAINIYSKETGVLLESVQNYNQWRAIEHQYLYDDPNNLNSKEGVGLPCQSYFYDMPGNANNAVLTPQVQQWTPHQLANTQLSVVDTALNPKYTSTRYMCPLKTGIFNHWDEEKLIPILNFGGLRIEIDLAQPEYALQHLSGRVEAPRSATRTRENINLDLVSDIAERGIPISGDNTGANNIPNANQIWLDADRVATGSGWASLSNCGLVVGSKLRMNRASGSIEGTVTEANLVVTAIEFDSNAMVTVNQQVLNPRIKVTLAGAIGAGVNLADGLGNRYVIILPSSQTLNYKVTKSEFRILQITPPPQVMSQLSKGLNYEFTSYDTFLDNVPSGALRHQVPINSVASKALAMFSVMYDTSAQTDPLNKHYFSGVPPEHPQSNLNNLVYFINNRLYPLRSYNPQAKGDKVLSLNELTKAWNAINKQPLNLGSNKYGDLCGYSNTFLIARELARSGFVFDLRNAEPEVRLSFSNTRTDILRLNTFVFSKRVIQTSAQGVQVIY